jgi:ligand-binding SRPBCC domain-containing protein
MARPIQFVASSSMNAPAERVFAFHEAPGALERLTPAWEPVDLVERPKGIRDGDRGVIRVGPGPFKLRWVIEHRDYVQNRQFRDVQISGPFRSWSHLHLITPNGPNASTLEDRIEFVLPLGAVGNFFGGWFVLRKLRRLFEFRHRITAEAVTEKVVADSE